MKSGGIKFRETSHVLRRNGWDHESTNGSHAKFKKGERTIVVCANSNGTHPLVWRRIVKENNLDTRA